MLYRLGFIVFICLLLAGCHSFCGPGAGRYMASAPTVKKETIDYVGDLPATQAGTDVALVRMKAAKTQSQLVLFTGNLTFRGKIKPENAAEEVPGTVRIELRKKSARGQIQNTLQFDLAVQSDGTIRPQKFPFNNILFVSPKESLEVSLTPIDADLPASDATLKFIYTPTATSQDQPKQLAEKNETDEFSTEARRFGLSYNGLLAPAPKGFANGEFRFTAVAGLDTPPVGNLNVKGKLNSQSASPLPTQLQLITKFTTAKGRLLSTERYDIRVNTDGTIPLQKYPLDTNIVIGTQALQFSVIAVDRDFPLSSAQIKIFFSRS